MPRSSPKSALMVALTLAPLVVKPLVDPLHATTIIVPRMFPSKSPEAQSSGATSTGVISEDSADSALSEVTDALVDELSMCLRYHQSLFRKRKIDRLVFLGGEARETGLCQHVARALRLPAQLGDPLTRLQCRRSLRTSGLALGQPQPGWAVACGLCTLPTDL